jgi:opacity protein-like surface antigen
MKNTHSLLSMAAIGGLALFVTLPGFSQASRFYVTGGIGPAFTEDTSLRELNGPVGGAKVKFDTGVQFRFTGGYEITDWLAAEFETGVIYNEIRSITGAIEADASLVNAPFLANLVIQCPKKSRFAPYIGGGLGGSVAVLDAHDIFLANGNFASGNQSDTVFAYQGFAGLRYHIDEHMSVSLGYRFFGTTAPTWESDFGPGRASFGDNHTHAVTAAFTFKF